MDVVVIGKSMKRGARTRGDAVLEGKRWEGGAGPESEGGRAGTPEPEGTPNVGRGSDRTARRERGSDGDKANRKRDPISVCGGGARAVEEETREQRVVEVCNPCRGPCVITMESATSHGWCFYAKRPGRSGSNVNRRTSKRVWGRGCRARAPSHLSKAESERTLLAGNTPRSSSTNAHGRGPSPGEAFPGVLKPSSEGAQRRLGSAQPGERAQGARSLFSWRASRRRDGRRWGLGRGSGGGRRRGGAMGGTHPVRNMSLVR